MLGADLSLVCALASTSTPFAVAGSFVVTAKLLFSPSYRRYGGIITIISLLSNTQLIAIRVAIWLLKTKQAHREGSALSVFMVVPKCANSIDKDYLFVSKYYKPAAADEEDEDDDAGDNDDLDDKPPAPDAADVAAARATVNVDATLEAAEAGKGKNK